MALNWFKKKKRAETTPDSATPDESPDERQEPLQSDPGGVASIDAASGSMPTTAQEPESAPVREQEMAAPSMDAGQTDRREKNGLFSRLKKGLTKTRQLLTTDIDELFGGRSQIDDDMLEELEELLITSDIGVQTAMDLIQAVSGRAKKIKSPEELRKTLKDEIMAHFRQIPAAPVRSGAKPHVIMVVGVNGVGKTTTIGKLAAKATQQGEATLIVAADTFRAAAIEQLGIWAQRAGADMVKHKANADPAAVAYDGMEAALARKMDTVFVDTAGRLHTKVNLMEELKKIKRTIAKIIPDAPHEVLLVLDATTGQNALSQAKMFHETLGVSGLALTKLDGTAKGGIVISICRSLNIPLQYVGVGEGMEDLQKFDPEQFAGALF